MFSMGDVAARNADPSKSDNEEDLSGLESPDGLLDLGDRL